MPSNEHELHRAITSEDSLCKIWKQGNKSTLRLFDKPNHVEGNKEQVKHKNRQTRKDLRRRSLIESFKKRKTLKELINMKNRLEKLRLQLFLVIDRSKPTYISKLQRNLNKEKKCSQRLW